MGANKTDWKSWYEFDWWQLYCAIFDEFGAAIPPDDEGKSAFRAANITRYLQGQPLTLDQPIDTWFPATGTITYDATGTKITFINTGGASITGFSATIYAKPSGRSNLQTVGQNKGLKFIASIPITPGVEYDLTPYLNAHGLNLQTPWTQIATFVGATGSVYKIREYNSLYP